MSTIFFFDLDGTVIDSSHRQGETLDDWRRMNTGANIAKDRALPLASAMVAAIRAGLDVNILTSRVMGEPDLNWLTLHAMLPGHGCKVISRHPTDERPAGTYKLSKLLTYSQKTRITWEDLKKRSVIFDDDRDVQETLSLQGFTVIDPITYNQLELVKLEA